jgi:hypothetical protein
MIEWIDIIWSDLASQFFNPKKRLFLGYLLSALVIATAWLCLIKRHSIGSAISTFFDRKIWLSRSSRQDLASFRHADLRIVAPTNHDPPRVV